jgi:hypothetical protein
MPRHATERRKAVFLDRNLRKFSAITEPQRTIGGGLVEVKTALDGKLWPALVDGTQIEVALQTGRRLRL